MRGGECDRPRRVESLICSIDLLCRRGAIGANRRLFILPRIGARILYSYDLRSDGIYFLDP